MYQILSNNVEDYEALLEFLFRNGYKFSGRTSVSEVNREYGRFEYPCLVVYDDLSLGGNYSFRDNGSGEKLTFPQDAAAIFSRVYKLKTYEIVIKDVGDYEATVTKSNIQVGCQTISFEKFAEIAEAVAQIRK